MSYFQVKLYLNYLKFHWSLSGKFIIVYLFALHYYLLDHNLMFPSFVKYLYSLLFIFGTAILILFVLF